MQTCEVSKSGVTTCIMNICRSDQAIQTDEVVRINFQSPVASPSHSLVRSASALCDCVGLS